MDTLHFDFEKNVIKNTRIGPHPILFTKPYKQISDIKHRAQILFYGNSEQSKYFFRLVLLSLKHFVDHCDKTYEMIWSIKISRVVLDELKSKYSQASSFCKY